MQYTLGWLTAYTPIAWEVISTADPKRWKKRENAHTVERIFDFTASLPNPANPAVLEFCVNEYGRIHHWTVDFYDDCHNENW